MSQFKEEKNVDTLHRLTLPGVTKPLLESGEKLAELESLQKGRAYYTEKQQNVFKGIKKRLAELERAMIQGEIEEIGFSLWSTEDKRKLAVVNCTSDKTDGPNTVRDDKFGPRNSRQRCATCQQDINNCPAHYGIIEHPKNSSHKLSLDLCISTLESVCPSCSKLLITKEQIEFNGFNRLPLTKKVKAIAEYIKKSNITCKHNSRIPGIESCSEKQGGTPIPQYNSISSNEKSYCLSYTYKGMKNSKYFRTPDEAHKILDSIDEEDTALLDLVPDLLLEI